MKTATALTLIVNNTEDNSIIMRWIRRFESKDTKRKYISTTTKFFNVQNIEEITNQMIKNTTDIHIENYIIKLADEKKARTTVKNTKECIASLFTFAKNKKYITENVFADKSLNDLIKLKTDESNKTVGKALTPEEITLLIEAIDNQRDKLMILLMLRTGVRVSETSKIKWKDIEFNVQENGWFLQIHGKGRKHRQIFVGEKMINELIEYAKQNNSILGESDDIIFPMSTGNINRILEKWSDKSGIKKVNPHDCRRTACTHLIKNNVPLTDVRNFLGHQKIETTMLYFKEYEDLKNNAGKFIEY